MVRLTALLIPTQTMSSWQWRCRRTARLFWAEILRALADRHATISRGSIPTPLSTRLLTPTQTSLLGPPPYNRIVRFWSAAGSSTLVGSHDASSRGLMVMALPTTPLFPAWVVALLGFRRSSRRLA